MNIRIIKRLNQGLNGLRCNSDLQSGNNFFLWEIESGNNLWLCFTTNDFLNWLNVS